MDCRHNLPPNFAQAPGGSADTTQKRVEKLALKAFSIVPEANWPS